jgi:hypothetical protein
MRSVAATTRRRMIFILSIGLRLSKELPGSLPPRDNVPFGGYVNSRLGWQAKQLALVFDAALYRLPCHQRSPASGTSRRVIQFGGNSYRGT